VVLKTIPKNASSQSAGWIPMVRPAGEAAGKTPSSPAAQPMAVGENIRTLAASKRKKVNETSLNF
jgi:hypothetical protein